MFSKSKISSCILYNVRHSPCYSYSIFRYRVFSVIEKENIRTMEMIHYHVKIFYFVTIDQFMKTKKGSQMWTKRGSVNGKLIKKVEPVSGYQYSLKMNITHQFILLIDLI